MTLTDTAGVGRWGEAMSDDILGVPRESASTSVPAKNWYAIYTCVNQEKQVAERLELRGIEFYLPLYRSIRRRSDRQVALDLPLFPGYVFVNIHLGERLRVLEVPRVVRLVGFQSRPVALPKQDVDLLRKGLSGQVLAQPCRYLTSGCRIRVVNGPFAGAEGVLLHAKRSPRVVISIALIRQAFTVEVGQYDVERL
jgi:transcription antitermination factor NusG